MIFAAFGVILQKKDAGILPFGYHRNNGICDVGRINGNE